MTTPTIPLLKQKPRESNAPRISYVKWFKKGETEFTPEYVELVKDLNVCYDLVKLAGHIVQRPLVLHVGDEAENITRAYTDGTNIFIPKRHPQRRIVTKHEISHIYFKSNIPLRLIFVTDMIARIEKESGNTSFDPATKSKLVDDLCFVINIFDDLRVNSLWGLLYPGDGAELDGWYLHDVGPRMLKKAEEDFPNGDISHLFTYIILLCLGQPAKSTEWGEFAEDIQWAANQVYFKTFNASLLLVQDLILNIIRKSIQKTSTPNNPTDRPDSDPELQKALDSTGSGDVAANPELDQLMKDRIGGEGEKSGVSLLTKTESGQRPDPSFEDDNAGFDFRVKSNPGNSDLDADLEELQEIEAGLGPSRANLEKILQSFEERALKDLLEIQKATTGTYDLQRGRNFENEYDYLKKSVKANVQFVDIKHDRLVHEGRRDRQIELHKLRDVGLRWRKFFLRVMGTLSHKTEEVGYELITDLYVQQKIGKEPLSCFKTDISGRGFRANILVDMSGSMASHFNTVEDLAHVLQTALNFPFVDLRVWGFNSRQAGTVTIYRFPKNAEGLRANAVSVEGITPLSQAIQIAGRDLARHRDDNHLFVLSDGFPYYKLEGGRDVNTKALMNWTHDAVQELRQQKVHVYCFMLGSKTPGPEWMDKMFGRGFWKNVNLDTTYDKAFSLITDRFLQFLRTR